MIVSKRKKSLHFVLAVIIVASMMLFCMTIPAKAVSVGDFEVIGGESDVDYSFANNTLTIITSTPLTIKNMVWYYRHNPNCRYNNLYL